MKARKPKQTYSALPRTPCSRFPAARIEELLQARDNLAEGYEISHKDACDLVNWYADELDRVCNAYQERLGEIGLIVMDLSVKTMNAMLYPSENNAISETYEK